MDVAIARWRLRTQHLTAPHAGSAAEVMDDLLAVQAENPSQSAWAVAARTSSPDSGDLGALLASGTRIDPDDFDREDALARLAVRYFTCHGPATVKDLAYWATLTISDVRRGLAAVGDQLDSFDHDGRTFWHAPGHAPGRPGRPAGHLLQLLDEMYRGFQDSRWVLDARGVVSAAACDRDRYRSG